MGDFSRPYNDMVVSWNGGTPNIIHCNGIFLYKPTILGIPIDGDTHIL